MGMRRMRFCTSEGTAPSPWRMLDAKAWSQGPFAEVVWHPWPALEWLQNRGKDIEGYQKAANLKAAVWTYSVSSASISSASSSIPNSPLQMSLCPTILCALLYTLCPICQDASGCIYCISCTSRAKETYSCFVWCWKEGSHHEEGM